MSTIPTATERETLLERIVADMPTFTAPACEADPYLFFVHDSQREEIAAAKKLCGTCPELDLCRGWALNNPHLTPYGVWGGMTEKERRGITGTVRICDLDGCHNTFKPRASQHRYCTDAHAAKARRRVQARHDQRRRP